MFAVNVLLGGSWVVIRRVIKGSFKGPFKGFYRDLGFRG